ncbi:unnamed protein product [Paramecium sonneborni]|uniref:Uncharacterized protein n=1 Tax=Paramecium sonneborni TaxID=65129 RepID=A0A8S1RQK8_9CILI|nr:unnamed protein product [Paramecium sonneborni]
MWLEVEDYRRFVISILLFYLSPTIILQQGIYQNGMKIGKWEINSKHKIIGGGNYNEKGQKFGQWIEIDEKKYWEYCQLLYFGNYQDGIKVGIWETHFCLFTNDIRTIGNGTYDENGIKVGQWTEVSETFWEKSQVIYKGQYENGIKSGRWNEYFCENKQNQLIGGGMYDQNGVKFGRWIEMHEYFSSQLQIIYVGTYSNGIKDQEFKQKKLQNFR